MSEDKEAAESCLSIDEHDAHCPSLDDVRIQSNWRQLAQQLTHNLLAGRQLYINNGFPTLPCYSAVMAQQNQDVPVGDQVDGNLAPILPVFDQLFPSGINFSLPSEECSNERIETNTSEYYSAENGNSASGNIETAGRANINESEHGEDVEQCRRRERNQSSGSRSSAGDEIQTKRASLVKSKEIYSSVEYDPSRRESIQITRGDSVFSEEVPPQSPQRRKSRERLVKQRSQSTSDLPDLIQSSPIPSPQSPDVVPVNDCPSQKRFRSVENLVNSDNDSCIEVLNDRLTFERKQEIEGKVHDGTTDRPDFRRSVSFQEKPTVHDIPSQDKAEGEESGIDKVPLSPHGEEGRQHFRGLKDSGYATGGSSKSSLQSQLSDQTNFSDSVLTDTSIDREEEEEESELQHGDSLSTVKGEPDQGSLPALSIFGSETSSYRNLSNPPSVRTKSLYVDGLGDSQKPAEHPEGGNMPCLSVFDENSGGSLRLRSEELSSSMYGPQNQQANRPTEEDLPSDSPSDHHGIYAGQVLDDHIERAACGKCEKCTQPLRSVDSENKFSTRDRSLLQQPLVEVFKFCIRQYNDPSTWNAEDCRALMFDLEKLQIPSDSSTPSPSPHDRLIANIAVHQLPTEKKEDTPYYTIPERTEVGVNLKLKEWLERASRCQYNKCDDTTCKKTKSLLQGFDESIQGNSTLDKEQESVLLALRCHSERCEDLKCSVPYCPLLCQIDPWDRYEAICQIRQKLDILLELTDRHLQQGRFLPLSPDCQHEGPLREGEEWIALSPLSSSRNVILISDQPFSNPLKLSVLKMMPMLEENHQWCVYEQLRGLTHPYIVQHLWVMEHGRDLLICTKFMEEGSLRHKLQEVSPTLPLQTVVSYVQQVISGVMELHRRGIIYINWTSCNILLDKGGRIAKVSNFAMSVTMMSQNVDFGGIKNTLPPAILPPELLDSSPHIYPVSDSWGCGCLLYELLLGHRVWYQYRHETKDYIWRMLKGKVPPVPQELSRWPEVFQACWQHDIRQRHPLRNIYKMLPLTLSTAKT